MIDTVRWHINDALARTSNRSTLSDDAKDAELAQASAEACDLLNQWLGSFEWGQLRPSGSAPIWDAIPEWERIRPFLDPLGEALARITQRQKNTRGARDASNPAAYIDEAIREAGRTARRYKRYDRGQLFTEAGNRIEVLRKEACEFAAHFNAEKETAQQRRKVRAALGTIAGLLLTLSLALASASPHDVRQNIPEWGHEAVKVLMIHDIAATAQPGVHVAPPRLGLRVRSGSLSVLAELEKERRPLGERGDAMAAV
jgi:hypothetical protein